MAANCPFPRSKLGWLIVAVSWTLAALGVSMWMAQWPGHPSGLFYVPLVILGWIVGCVMLLRDFRRAARPNGKT